jgi:hypothetical protein
VDKARRAFPVSLSTCLLVSIVAVYLLLGLQYAALTPRWQVPDEPAHYNYIRYIAENGELPVLDPGEYQQGYLAELTSKKFPPELSIDSLQYESWQPPLYYLLAAPLYLITNGALLPLRLFSLLIGAGVIVFAYLAVREAVGGNHVGDDLRVAPAGNHVGSDLRVAPTGDHIGLPLLAAGFIAFIPQHLAMMAGVNNDSLSELLIAIGLWLILRINNQRLKIEDWKLALSEVEGLGFGLLGLVIGLAFLTKSQAYVLAPVAGIMLVLRWRRGLQSPISNPPITNYQLLLITHLTLVFLPALLLGALWWGRNLALYGWPDFMAAIRHDQVVADQPRTAQWVAEFGRAEVIRRFLQTTFQSFWGQFGWMGVPMPPRYYALLGVFTAMLIVGWVIGYLRMGGLENSPILRLRSGQVSNSLISNYYLLIASALLTLALYLSYNLTYVQHQGRYLFPALVPIGWAAAIGLSGWGQVLSRLTRREVGWIVGAGALVGMAALCLFALYRFILPAL